MAYFIDDQETQNANLDYIRHAMGEPMLERDDELELARHWRDEEDEEALHELTGAYARLVVAIATRFRSYGLPVGDLIQEGNIGLMQAANNFDPERGFRFSTYATWWIRAAIQDYILRNWSIVRTGTTSAQKSLFFKLRALRAKIEAQSKGKPLDDSGRKKIAKELNVKEVEDMEARFLGDRALNARIGIDGEEEWQTLLTDDRLDPEEFTIGVKDTQMRSGWLANAMAELPEREQIIIRERHLNDKTATLETIGNSMGISKERVRQLEQRAMSRLKESLTEQVPDRTDLFH
jgi:RNA polymerase sigma-32 factor